LGNAAHFHFLKKQKVSMTRIRTSDNPPVTVNHFERVQGIVNKIRETPVIKGVLREEPPGEVRYNGHSIAIDDRNAMAAQIPNVLGDMDRNFYQGKVYAGRPKVYTRSFAKYINFLLTWFQCLVSYRGMIDVHVTASQMKSGLKWLSSVQEHLHVDMSDDSVDDIIASL
jgi:hypothetical protein